MSLCASKRDLQTFSYSRRVKKSFKFLILYGGSYDFGELSIDEPNRLANHWSEYWYIGSMVARSIMAKNRTEALKETGLKSSLVLSISFSVISDSFILTLISSLVLLESSRMLINSSSSRISAMFSFFVNPVRI